MASARNEEDVLSYALFPREALEFFKDREMNEKGVNLKDIAAVAVLYMRSTRTQTNRRRLRRQDGPMDQCGPPGADAPRGVADLKLKITANGQAHEVLVEKNGGDYRVTIGNETYRVVLKENGVSINGELLPVTVDGALNEGANVTTSSRQMKVLVEPVREMATVAVEAEATSSGKGFGLKRFHNRADARKDHRRQGEGRGHSGPEPDSGRAGGHEDGERDPVRGRRHGAERVGEGRRDGRGRPGPPGHPVIRSPPRS